MKKIAIYTGLFLLIWIVLAQFIIFKNRIGDKTALRQFSAHNKTLEIFDTIIAKRKLHYAISGDDSLPTLVFIHGSPGSWSNYREYMWDSSLSKKFRMVSIDRPGFGYSDFGQAMHLNDQCAIILPLLKEIRNDQPMYLFGHSMGAPVAVRLAALAPDLCTKIILAGSPLDVGLETPESWRRIMNYKPFYWALPGAFGPSNTELIYLKTDLQGLQRDFASVKCDVQFIHGDRDSWVPIENVAYGWKMLVNARSLQSDTIIGAGHLFPWENKSKLIEILNNIGSN